MFEALIGPNPISRANSHCALGLALVLSSVGACSGSAGDQNVGVVYVVYHKFDLFGAEDAVVLGICRPRGRRGARCVGH